jgi:hypothetical protein
VSLLEIGIGEGLQSSNAYLFFGEQSEPVFEGAVLIFEPDEFLFVPFEDVDLVLEVSDDDVFLVGLDLERGVEVGGSLGGRHLILKVIN